jgi:thiamine biosynthesis lipoprotein
MNTCDSPSKRFNRRTFLQIVAVAGAAGACWQMGLFTGNSKLQVARRSQPIMGTYLNLTVYGHDRDACEAAVDTTIRRMLALEGKLSRHMESSEVFRLNTTGALTAPGKDLLEVLQLSRQLSRKTEGAFDITVLPLLAMHDEIRGNNSHADANRLSAARSRTGDEKILWNTSEIRFSQPEMGITLDGIGKGYIVDQGVAALKELDFHNIYVDAGGDLMVSGAKPDGSPWRIGIRSPREESSGKSVTVALSDRAIATSGDYFQAFTPDLLHHHIINPHTGFSSPELASCTITAPSVVMADGLATAVMVLGHASGLELLETMDGCEGYLIDKQQRSYHTSGFFG